MSGSGDEREAGFAGWLGRNIVLAVGLTVAGVMFGLSAWMNYQFGLTLGVTEAEKQVYGLASVTSDAFKALLPFLIIGLWRGHKLLALAAAGVWCLCVAWSMASAIGFASSTRDETVAKREAVQETRAALRERAERLEAQIALLPAHRPAGALEAAIANADVPRDVWRRTSQCSDVTIGASLEACREVLALRQELAIAEDAARLEQALAVARADLKGVAVVGDQGDPQAETIGFVTGAEAGSVRATLAVLITLLIETGSSLGFTIVALGSRRLRGRLSLPGWPEILGDPETRHAAKLRKIQRRGELGEAGIRTDAKLEALKDAKAKGKLEEQQGAHSAVRSASPGGERTTALPTVEEPLQLPAPDGEHESSSETHTASISAMNVDDPSINQDPDFAAEDTPVQKGDHGALLNHRAQRNQKVRSLLPSLEREAARRRRDDPDRDESA